jgi:hypothetical protein
VLEVRGVRQGAKPSRQSPYLILNQRTQLSIQSFKDGAFAISFFMSFARVLTIPHKIRTTIDDAYVIHLSRLLAAF